MRQSMARARTAPAKKLRGDFVTPHYVRRLMYDAGITVTEAAKRLGTQPTTLYRAVRENAVAKHREVAARGVLSEMGIQDVEPGEPAALPTTQLDAAIVAPTSEGVVSFLVAVPESKADVIRNSIRAMGGRIFVEQD